MSSDAVAAILEALEESEPQPDTGPHPKRFCFVEGTHIATLRGEMPVQNLRVGDHIRAKKGSFHVVSDVAVFAFDDLEPEAQGRIALSQLLRGAIDEGLPRRDYYVTEGQQFELSRRLEVAHAVRMTVRKSGAALRGYRFVVFACEGLPMIRAEGIWTTLTPMERLFPAMCPVAEAIEPEEETTDAAPSPEASPEPVAPAAPAAPAAPLVPVTPRSRSTRRPLTRMLSRPVSVPASHHTETGTPAP
jgi:hypothetical protein